MGILRTKEIQALCSAQLSIQSHMGFEFVFVDYRGLKETDMIKLASQHADLTLLTGLSFIADLNDAYATPAFMDHVKILVKAVSHISYRGALLGIDPVKEMILKGLVRFFGANYRAFEDREKALRFLMDASEE